MSTRICAVEDCGKPVHGHGFCIVHYSRFKRHGSPTGGRSTVGRPSGGGITAAWLEKHKLHDGEDCLTWPFNTDPHGYGKISHNGKQKHVSRIVCEFRHGPPPSPRHHAAHSCGKGHLGCVNPKHLSWKTPKENSADMVAHGTALRGEKNGKAKLTCEQVLEIRAAKHLSPSALAKTFNVTRQTISSVLLGESWAWL